MTALRSILRKNRVLNHERHFFLPEGSLDACITPQAVRDILTACQIPAWNVEEIQTAILSGAKKTFAILVLIKQEGEILRFFESDDFQSAPLDSKLPFSLELLERIILTSAEEFFEEQWLVTAPVFPQQHIHRYFSDQTILPFMSIRSLGRGGFGQVHEITIPWSHQKYFNNIPGLSSQGIKLAKKELDIDHETAAQPAESWKVAGASEHEVLSILHHLKHPSILELLASYTYQGKHNLIFPVATGGDLQALLTSTDRPAELQMDDAIYTAMAGLASALATLHDYRSSTFDMELMGFHHDLKPKNILVSGDRFILSDFGLSKLEARDNSKTEFKIGRGHYLAPECEDLLNNFKKGTITRASDVWSFGCVLLEVVIFMRYGANGIDQFREDRRYQLSNYTTRTFFLGSGLNPAVTSWAKKLSTEDSSAKRAIQLVLKILRIHSQDRPRAKEVAITLRSIAIQSLYHHARENCHLLLASHNTYDISLEVQRLEVWGSLFDFHIQDSEIKDSDDKELFYNNSIFETVTQALKSLSSSSSKFSKMKKLSSPVHFDIRALNDTLFGQLNSKQQERANHRLECQLLMLSEDNDISPMESLWLPYVDRTMIKATKLMHSLTEDIAQPKRHTKIPRETLRQWKPFQASFQAIHKESLNRPDVPVLIEWIVYDIHWTEEIGLKLFSRVGALIELLSSHFASRVHLLPCRGCFHAPDKHALGVVYELPFPAGNAEILSPNLLSLHDFIQSTQDVRKRPFLGDLFRFAHSLALSLSNLHQAGWLHKALTPYNIIFSTTSNDQGVIGFAQSYKIIGLNHSRPDNPTEYTEAVWKRTAESRLYHHPKYLEQMTKFCTEYDYYSFGLILLELGMWKSLSSMASRPEEEEKTAPQIVGSTELTQYLLERRVPLLGPKMGQRYRDVVSYCLSLDLNKSTRSTEEGRSIIKEVEGDTRLDFERNVLQELSRCEL